MNLPNFAFWWRKNNRTMAIIEWRKSRLIFMLFSIFIIMCHHFYIFMLFLIFIIVCHYYHYKTGPTKQKNIAPVTHNDDWCLPPLHLLSLHSNILGSFQFFQRVFLVFSLEFVTFSFLFHCFTYDLWFGS